MLHRREFLIGGAQLAAFATLGPDLTAAKARTEQRDRILVVVELIGGNDGLNTLIPKSQDAWFRARPTLSRVATTSHELDDDFALHPALGNWAKRYADGELMALHSVGYEQPNRSHFRSQEIWHTGLVPEQTAGESPAKGGVGWLGRAAAGIAEQRATENRATEPVAIHIGGGVPPLSLLTPGSIPATIDRLDTLALADFGHQHRELRELVAKGEAHGELGFLRSSASAARRLAARLETAAGGDLSAEWPTTPFAERLALVATLINGGLGASIYALELGSFDTHLDQGPTHAHLLSQLDSGLDAFMAEVRAQGLAEQVTVLIHSEFGRRVAENGTGGTDHGAAAPVFLAGAALAGGMFGEAPNLECLEQGDLPFGIDLRSVHATLERDWLGVAPNSDLPRLPLFA